MSFERYVAVWLVTFVAFGVVLTLLDHPDELDREQALYCEMVETFKTTGGEYGWPDYRGVYERACK